MSRLDFRDSAVHESGHLYFMHKYPAWREAFGKHIRAVIIAPGLAFIEGQNEPFDSPSKWIPLDTPAESKKEMMLTECAPAIAELAARSLLAGPAAGFADRNEMPDADLRFAEHGDLTLSPDFTRAIAIVERLQSPTIETAFNYSESFRRYETARAWCSGELRKQIEEMRGDPIASIRKCAEMILSKPDLTLSWPEAELCFTNKNLTPPTMAAPDTNATKAATLNPSRQNAKPSNGLVRSARRVFALLFGAASPTKNNMKD